MAMSRESVLESFFDRIGTFLEEIGLKDAPSKIYNIDETWYSQNEQKRKRILVPLNHKMPYMSAPGKQEHITMAMCASVEGNWLPPCVIFKNTLPSNDEYHISGPTNALFMATESGHIDSASYFAYIKHLDQYLNPERPVVVFQDNLKSHEDNDLIEFCAERQIHLVNFPPKTSHILQPLDKVFHPLKTKIDKKKDDALIVNNGAISKSKVPILLRFAMNDMRPQTIRDAFLETGVYPFNKSAIDPSLLVGDVNGEYSC